MYIRTKYEIVKVETIADIQTKVIFKDNFVAQSENIEELCDEFVCEWFDKKVNRYRHVYCSFKIDQSKELYRRDIPLPPDVDFEIYAGIWLKGKGLTYVAKMDSEGKLVLI